MIGADIYVYKNHRRLYRKDETSKIFGVTPNVLMKWVSQGKFIRPDYGSAVGGRRNQAYWTQEDIDKEKAKRGIK